MNWVKKLFSRNIPEDQVIEPKLDSTKINEAAKKSLLDKEKYLLVGDDEIVKSDREISKLVRAESIHSDYIQIDDAKSTLRTKLSYLHSWVLKNKKSDFPLIEKFLFEIITGEELTIYQKLCLVAEFSRYPSGSTLLDTNTWIFYTTAELYWKIFNLDNISLRCKIVALGPILRADIDTHRKLTVINEIKNIISLMENNINTNLFSDLYGLCLRTHIPEGQTLAADIRQILNRRNEAEEMKNPLNISSALEEANKTIYHDHQNVHVNSIEESVAKMIDALANDVYYNSKENGDVVIIKKEDALTCLDEIQNVMSEMGILTNSIRKSLNRICIDTSLFGQSRYRTRDILQKVWLRLKYKIIPACQEEAVKILAEELTEASDICSSGFAARIVNVLNRFPENLGGISESITISWQEQIKANINARVNYYIRLENNDQLLTAMISNDEKEFQIYVNFLKEILPRIEAELMEEFSPLFDMDQNNMPILTEKDFREIFQHNYMLLMIKK